MWLWFVWRNNLVELWLILLVCIFWIIVILFVIFVRLGNNLDIIMLDLLCGWNVYGDLIMCVWGVMNVNFWFWVNLFGNDFLFYWLSVGFGLKVFICDGLLIIWRKIMFLVCGGWMLFELWIFLSSRWGNVSELIFSVFWWRKLWCISSLVDVWELVMIW